MTRRTPSARRRGAIVPLTALMLVIFVGMVAFAVDISNAAQAQAELQAAVDSAALAAGQALGVDYVNINVNTSNNKVGTATTDATNAAIRNGQANNVANNPLQLSAADVTFGYTGSAGYPAGYSAPTNNFPNTVTVTKTGLTIPVFFGGVFGTTSQTIQATATVVLQAGSFNSLDANGPNPGGSVIPFTYSVDWYNQYLSSGNDPQNPPSGTTTINGQTYNNLSISPNKLNNAPSQIRGWLSLNFSTQGQGQAIQNWISNGVSQSDIQAMQANNGIPLDVHAQQSQANQFNWAMPDGNKNGLMQRFPTSTDTTWMLPLYALDPSGSPTGAGLGANGFNIVQFVPVHIIQASVGNLLIVPSTSYPDNSTFSIITGNGNGSGSSGQNPLNTTTNNQGSNPVTYVFPRLVN